MSIKWLKLSPRLLWLLLPLVAATGARAQTVTLDEGVFRLEQAGREVGTETFSIRRNGRDDSAVTIAQGRINLDTAGTSEALTASLELTGSELRPSAYQVAVQGRESQRIAGRLTGRRFNAKIISPAGEMMREYLAGEDAVLADEGVAHHLYFLARRVQGGSARVPVIIPRQSRQVTARVTSHGTETIRIGGRSVQARRLTVEADGAPPRLLWVDGEDRVLRVEVPSREYVAVRTALP